MYNFSAAVSKGRAGADGARGMPGEPGAKVPYATTFHAEKAELAYCFYKAWLRAYCSQ